MYRNSRVSPKLQTRILCLCNSPSAVSVVPVVSVVWRGCLFYASGLCSFWQTVRAFCQSLPGKHSYNKHQHFFSPSFQPQAQVWSRAELTLFWDLGSWDRAQTNRISPLHLQRVTKDLQASGSSSRMQCPSLSLKGWRVLIFATIKPEAVLH